MTGAMPLGWRCAQLVPSRHPRAAPNLAVLGPLTLGIEVTEPDLAARCGLGNLDPQHGPQHGGGDPTSLAAIEAACAWPLPPRGATLAILRPDADALGAAAVLCLRAAGIAISGATSERIAQIAWWDRLARGAWEPWRKAHPPLLRPACAADLGGKSLELRAIDALARIEAWPLAERVLRIAAWLGGEAPPPREALAAALDYEARLLADWNAGRIAVSARAGGRLAVLRSAGAVGALDLAYRLAPVVVAAMQAPAGVKLTVAQFEPGRIDLAALLAELGKREPGWGGTATILGSPQGADSRLTLEEVAELAEGFLLSSA